MNLTRIWGKYSTVFSILLSKRRWPISLSEIFMKLSFLSLHSKLVDEGIPEFINKFRTTEAAILAKNLLTKSILKHTFVLYSYYL